MGRGFNRFKHRSIGAIKAAGVVLNVLTLIAATATLTLLVIYAGYRLEPDEITEISRTLRAAQGIFVVRIIYGWLFPRSSGQRSSTALKWTVEGLVMLTLLPAIYPHPEHPWIPWLEALLYSRAFLNTALGAYAAVTLCFGLQMLVGKRTNPSLLLSGSFLLLILIGSLLLMLPNCTYAGIRYIDALFVSTSAVCITGLSSVDIYVNFTPMGLAVLAVLVQIGALGVMTFTSFFALFFSGSPSIYSQLLLRDMIYSRSMSALLPTLLYILGFTLVVEAAGAALIWASVHGELGMSLEEEVVFALFHSLSGFCNAGFSTYPDGLANPLLLDGHLSLYWIMSALIIAGSIGFPILVNFRDVAVYRMRRIWRRLRLRHREARNVHPFNMNTKIVLVTFFALFILGAAGFWLIEHDHALRGMSPAEQLTQAVFNSATPRSAGFSSVAPATFMPATLVMVMLLMWVGGASQSTGGGIKVNTLAALLLNLRAVITGRERVNAFGRNVSVWSIRRANSVVTLSIITYAFYSLTLLCLEPELEPKALLFEACSALFTVGSSLGVTPELSEPSKGLLCTAMFIGRVGVLSLLIGLAGRRHEVNATYPSDNIIIN